MFRNNIITIVSKKCRTSSRSVEQAKNNTLSFSFAVFWLFRLAKLHTAAISTFHMHFVGEAREGPEAP